MPIHIKEKTKCSGCHACFNLCPQNCISMEEDSEGFLYPCVDYQVCVGCNLCEKVCPMISDSQTPISNVILAYAAMNKDNSIRSKSSSGGCFSALADVIIEKKGVVYGAAFDRDFFVKTMFVESREELSILRGSKYVQSVVGNTFTKIKDQLEGGQAVLFSGTPCQIAGLHAFLGKVYSELFTVDFVCHGVPSPLVWRKYLSIHQKKSVSKIDNILFRDKTKGWKNYSVIISFFNGSNYSSPFSDDPYMDVFLKNLCLRPSCYECPFKGNKRYSDITLADFWGIENVCADMDDDKGTSLVLINSEKGQKLFDSTSSMIIRKAVDLDRSCKYNFCYAYSVEKPIERDSFLKQIRRTSFDVAFDKIESSKRYAVIRAKIKSYINPRLNAARIKRHIKMIRNGR